MTEMARPVKNPQQPKSPLARWRVERCDVSVADMAAALGLPMHVYMKYERAEEEYPPAFLKKLEEYGLVGKEVERSRREFCLAKLEELRRQIKERLGVEG